MDDKGKRLILCCIGGILLFYAFTPDPLPVFVDNIIAGVLGVKLLTTK